MAYDPVSRTVPQYQVDGNTIAAGYFLKGYTTGTTTPLSMATDDTGGTLIVKCKLNTAGYPLSNDADDTTVFIPHFNAKFKLALYTNAIDADNNTTANAVWVVDAIPVNTILSEAGTSRVVATSTGADVFGTRLDLDNSGAASGADIAARNSEGGFLLRADNDAVVLFQTTSAGVTEDQWIRAVAEGLVELRHNNIARFQTTLEGADVFGTIFDINNSASADATSIFMRNSEGGIRLSVDGDEALIRQTASDGTTEDTWIKFFNNAAVELFFNDTKEFETKSGGVIVDDELEVNGALNHDGSTVGFYGTAPASQPAAYTRNTTIVEDRTLLASASATATNNNNVLAALIADLQSLGLIQ